MNCGITIIIDNIYNSKTLVIDIRNATPLGITAIYKGLATSKPPYEQAIKEGEELSMDLSREEK